MLKLNSILPACIQQAVHAGSLYVTTSIYVPTTLNRGALTLKECTELKNIADASNWKIKKFPKIRTLLAQHRVNAAASAQKNRKLDFAPVSNWIPYLTRNHNYTAWQLRPVRELRREMKKLIWPSFVFHCRHWRSVGTQDEGKIWKFPKPALNASSSLLGTKLA